MYSPGSLKVALAVALPPASLSIVGFAFSNVTVPGPRNLLHVIDSGGGDGSGAPDELRPRPRPGGGGSGMLIFGPSSVTHAVSVTGSEADVLYVAEMPEGGPVNVGPSVASLSTGGVFLLAASSNGSTIHSGFKCIVMTLVCPLDTNVHVSFRFPKSFGTLMENTPH